MTNTRINDKISEIEQLLSQLEEIMPANLEEYIHNFEKKFACERCFEVIVEAVVDLAFLLIKLNKLKIPQEDTEAFFILAEKNIIKITLAEKFRRAKGMRNVIAHEYGRVDDELVFEALTTELVIDVRDFLEQIRYS